MSYWRFSPKVYSTHDRYAVSHNCLNALCDLLHCYVEEVLLNILKALKRVLEVGASEEVNPYTTAIEKANGKW